MANKRIIFFDTTWNQLLRVGNLIAKEIKSVTDLEIYGLVFETSDNIIDVSCDSHFFDKVFVSRNISKVNNFIYDIQPDIVVFAQNTIPDLYAILHARKAGAKIVMLQHGLLYDGATLNNVRIGEIFAALHKAKKTFTYLNILRLMCHSENKSFLLCLAKMIYYKYNVTTTIQNFFDPPLRGDIAFVIGSHWIDYYSCNYGYNKDCIYVMGNHDVDDLEEGHIIEDAICYIPSVHVEDGKVRKEIFVDFLKALSESIPLDKKIYIKFHPRSDQRLYRENMKNKNIVYVEGKDLPYVRTYIGHNSSLLSKALNISGVVILWGFKEEPELFYKDFAYAVCSSKKELTEAVQYVANHNDYTKKESVELFSYKNPVGAYKYCGLKIIELYYK